MSNRRTVNDVISSGSNPNVVQGGQAIPNRVSQLQNSETAFILNENRSTTAFQNLTPEQLRTEN